MTFKFILLGFTKDPQQKLCLFSVFLSSYMLTLLGNLVMVFLIIMDDHLHKPMYFFLGQLSFLDTCYSSVISAKMLIDLLNEDTSISFNGCAAQMYFFVALGSAESFLLAAMAYDRYVAICNPLCYIMIMSRSLCIWFVAACYFGGFLHSGIYVICIFRLPFCESNEVHHFFCDVPPLLKLACVDTSYIEILLFAFTGTICMSCLIMIFVSYTLIISTILNIRATKKRTQTFSTCASHFTAVSIYFGTILFMYLKPKTKIDSHLDRVVSVFYTVVIPLLNPIIYSIRNRDVKIAMKRVLCNT